MFTAARRSGQRTELEGPSKVYMHVCKRSGHARKTHMGDILNFQSADLTCMTLANKRFNVSFKAWPVKVLMYER
jgi:hypothetical protein